jgi:uncharacterized iron-regulated membrane protein
MSLLDWKTGTSDESSFFSGLPETLFWGAMGLLFLASIVSGIVVYEPFMQKLPFGAIRREAVPRLSWLDLHNLLGIVTVLGSSWSRRPASSTRWSIHSSPLAADGDGEHADALDRQAGSDHPAARRCIVNTAQFSRA